MFCLKKTKASSGKKVEIKNPKDAGLRVKPKVEPEAGKLKSIRNGKWESSEGLIYGQGSIHGNRVKHVLDHTVPNPNKPSHTIFNVDKNKVIGLVDEAWKSRGKATENRGNDLYDILMGKVVGINGETKIRIVTKRGTNEILSAYPRR